MGVIPLKYLGISSNVRIINKHWKCVEDKIEKGVGVGKGKMLIIACRQTLVHASSSNIPLYMMSFYTIAIGVKERELIPS